MPWGTHDRQVKQKPIDSIGYDLPKGGCLTFACDFRLTFARDPRDVSRRAMDDDILDRLTTLMLLIINRRLARHTTLIGPLLP